MIALLQRVTKAQVTVAGDIIASIGPGLLVLVGIERDDSPSQATRLLERLLSYRVFSDDQGRMNQSLADIKGNLLLVPQFTLAADTRKGTRPSFTPAAPPVLGKQLFDYLLARAKILYPKLVAAGRFGAHMQVTLTNDGPVTFTLRVPPEVKG
jgi:D-tyrosyl-tRNA(Tyr) deacylase